MSFFSPVNQARWARFRHNRRGYWSLWLFLILFLCSLGAELLGQRISVILHLVLRLELKRGIFHNVAVHGNAAAANFTPGNSPADAELLSDKLIKSHEIFLACHSAGAGKSPEKEEFHRLV